MNKRVYLDTSVLVALLCYEPEVDFLIGWYRKSREDQLITTPWIRTELASALAIKQRSTQISATEAVLAWEQGIRILRTTRTEMLLTEDFERAAALCANVDGKLRGPDALHLAAALRLGCQQLASLDEVLCRAALSMKLQLVDFRNR